MFGLQRLRNFWCLTHQSRWLFLQTFAWLTLVRLGLRFIPFQVLRRRLWVSNTRPLPSTITVPHIIWAVQKSSQWMPGGAKCLAKALTTQRLMQTYGYTPIFKIGVSKQGQGTFEAHAWIEYEGEVVIGQLENLAEFVPLPL